MVCVCVREWGGCDCVCEGVGVWGSKDMSVCVCVWVSCLRGVCVCKVCVLMNVTDCLRSIINITLIVPQHM